MRLLRDEMRVELKRLQERLGTTMIFVTHDQAEALILSDRVVVMEAGRVEQVGRPEEVYRRPATRLRRALPRARELLRGHRREDRRGRHRRRGRGRALARGDGRAPGMAAGQRVQVAIRQESIAWGRRAAPSRVPTSFAATVVFHAFAGAGRITTSCSSRTGASWRLRRPAGAPALARGSRAVVEWAPEDVVLLPEGARRGRAMKGGRGMGLLLPAMLLLLVAFVLPVGMLVPTSFRPYVPLVGITRGFTGGYYTRLVTDSYYLEIIGRTLALGLTVTLATLLMGYPCVLLARTRSRWRTG
jgi:hypothetical protein